MLLESQNLFAGDKWGMVESRNRAMSITSAGKQYITHRLRDTSFWLRMMNMVELFLTQGLKTPIATQSRVVNFGRTLDNIISWTSAGEGTEVAMSFKTAEAANEAWHIINLILGREVETTEDDLPKKPTLINLTQIAEKINTAMYYLAKRSKMTQQLLANKVSHILHS